MNSKTKKAAGAYLRTKDAIQRTLAELFPAGKQAYAARKRAERQSPEKVRQVWKWF